MEKAIISIFASTIILFFPGYVIQRFFLKDTAHLTQSVVLSLGLSVSFIPLLFLWASIFNIPLTRDAIVLIYALFIMVGIYIFYKSYSIILFLRNTIKSTHFWILFSVLLITLTARLYIPVSSDLPIGVDSRAHAIITQLIVENKGLPNTYFPYAPFDSFTYHFGFHTIVTVFHYLTKIDIINSMFFVAQILNTAILFSIYLFSYEISKSKTTAIFSIIFVGWISIFPGYYVNWGNYPQTAGLVILPILLAFITQNIEKEKNKFGTIFISAMLVGGLFLIHYRMFLLFIYFMISYLLISCIYGNLRKHMRFLSLVAFISIIFISFRVLTVLKSGFARNQSLLPQEFFSFDRIYYLENYLFLIDGYIGYAIVLSGCLIGISYKHLKKNTTIIILWILLMFALSNPFWINLPLSGYLDTIRGLTILFVPLSIFSGYALASIFNFLSKTKNLPLYLIILFLVASSVNAFTVYRDKPSPQYVLNSDLEAMDWIINNTKNDSLFLINGYFNKYTDFIEGTDGGMWIPFFTKRQVSIPPMLYVSESSPIANYTRVVKDLYIASKSMTSDDSLSLFKKYGITHVYIGKLGGLIRAEELMRDPNYELIYSKEGVKIFKILYRE